MHKIAEIIKIENEIQRNIKLRTILKPFVSICNLLKIAISYLDETFRKCLTDIPLGILIAIMNIIRMIHFELNEFL